MRLALIADVHGNLEALDAVIADIDERSPDARIVCAGDLVGYGPDPEACIDRLRSIGVPCVMGNHEEMVLGRRGFSRCTQAGITAAVWTRQNLSPGATTFLGSLPPWRHATPRVVVCHGNLDDAGLPARRLQVPRRRPDRRLGPADESLSGRPADESRGRGRG